jgi:alpha-glucosidase
MQHRSDPGDTTPAASIAAADSSAWWATAVVYEIYIRSFADSNGDGVGDLPGITSRLDYLADLGVDALWITPFYLDGGVDGGYDIVDHCNVDPACGTLDDFDTLVTEAHRRGLRIIVDIVLNHTSNQHPWFQAALAGDKTARDRYLWRDGAGGGPPNNWQSFFGGSAWTFEPTSQQWWCHLFDRRQPDLNWRNVEVRDEGDRILRFWMDRGVDGFRIDVAHGFVKDADFADDPAQPASTAALLSEWRAAGSAPTLTWRSIDQDDVFDIFEHWRAVIDSHDPGRDRMMVGELSRRIPPDRVAAYCATGRLHTAFNFRLLDQPWDAAAFAQAIRDSWDAATAAASPPTWVLSNHDRVRHRTRYGGSEQRARAAAALQLALPGSVYLFQGDELGLEDADTPDHLRRDPVWFTSAGSDRGRDGCRTPFPWDADIGAGWGPDAWLPVPAGWETRSVAAQLNDPASTLHLYRQLLTARRAAAGRVDSSNVATFEVSVDGDTLEVTISYRDMQPSVAFSVDFERGEANSPV